MHVDSHKDWYSLNVQALEAELAWLMEVIEFRFAQHFNTETKYASIDEVPEPDPRVAGDRTPFLSFLIDYDLSGPERLLIILALSPYLQPGILDIFLQSYPDRNQVTEFGGYKAQVHRGFLPTIETALFLLAGSDLGARIYFRALFDQDYRFFKDGWLKIEQLSQVEPLHTALILPTKELLAFVTTGDLGDPEFGPSFPAQKIETHFKWSDLVLPEETMSEIDDIRSWIRHESNVMTRMRLGEKVSPGFRALFYGPPGTGKTFTASLIGKVTDKDVYRIDLSMVVSKYIGETEKNLKVVFDKAQSRGWILFFDEADALFGKRTDVGDSKDRYANQEVSYLLQRVENFDGIVILATNHRDNMDKAFTRRFQAVVSFPMPNIADRLKLWKNAIPDTYALADNLNLQLIAERYEIAGGSIMNVVRHCALRAAVRESTTIRQEDLLEGIRKEYKKSGRIMN